jgi:septal ring-binding cell division protein DamX
MSRESELYRDKIEVSLDGRQIFYLFFGGAVIVGLVFVLGVMIGRRVEARGHVGRAQTAAETDPLAALDRLEGGKLSFQGTLRGAESPPSDVEKTIGELAKARQPAVAPAPAVPKVADKKPEPAAAPAPVVDKKLEPVTRPDVPAVADKKPEPAAVADKKPEPAAIADKKAEPAAVADKKPESADKKPEPAAADKKPAADKPEKKARYTLQLSSFQDRGEATTFLDAIKASGYQAYLTEGEVDGKQFYRVRLGSYRSLDAANDAKIEFEKASKKSALVVTKL